MTAYTIKAPGTETFYKDGDKNTISIFRGNGWLATQFGKHIVLCVVCRSISLALLTKDKENASQHPDLYSSKSLGLGRVGGDVVEDVDQHQEEGDEESHATCAQ